MPTRMPAKAEAQSITLSVRATSVRRADRRVGIGGVATGEWVIVKSSTSQLLHFAETKEVGSRLLEPAHSLDACSTFARMLAAHQARLTPRL